MFLLYAIMSVPLRTCRKEEHVVEVENEFPFTLSLYDELRVPFVN